MLCFCIIVGEWGLCGEALQPEDPYLTNELADALVAEGHDVQVVVLDWSAPAGDSLPPLVQENGVQVLVIRPRMLTGLGRSIELVIKWTFSSAFAAAEMRKTLAGRSFDALIAFSPSCTVAAQVLWSLRCFRPRSYLVVWDFFPFHHRSIGLISNPAIFRAAHAFEQLLLRRFAVVGCMSPMNAAYLRTHYKLHSKQRVVILPIWGNIERPPFAKDAVRTAWNLPLDQKIVVFGGQLTEGRGVENILAAARLARDKASDITFLVIGEGRLERLAAEYVAAGGSNLVHKKRVPRTAYLQLLTACNIGLVCTAASVDVPTFPSKTIDYVRARLPIVAAVEESTDYGRFVEEQGIGLSIRARDPSAWIGAIRRLIDDGAATQRLAPAQERRLREIFNVRRAAQRIVAALADDMPR